METVIGGWGFSYVLRPFLASIVGALFQSVLSLFTNNPTILLAASRMCSVLSVSLCCWFCLRLGHRCFSGYYSSFLIAWGVDLLSDGNPAENGCQKWITLLAGLVWIALFEYVAVTTMSKMML